MAKVTGTLNDFGLQNLAEFSPRVIFRASNPSTLAERVFSARDITVTPNATGAFSADLQPTDNVMPAMHYTVRVEWLDAPGGYVGIDLLDWPLYVPAVGGVIGDLMAVPSNPAQVWVGLTPPVNPTPGTWWFETNPDDLNDARNTGNIYEWR